MILEMRPKLARRSRGRGRVKRRSIYMVPSNFGRATRSAALLAAATALGLSGCPVVPIYSAPEPTESSGDESGDGETGATQTTQGDETETDGESSGQGG